MSILFTASEVVTMAIEIEKNGMNFYNTMSARADRNETKELFTFLAGEEVVHKATFQKMLNHLKNPELTASEGEEYNSYLRALTSSRVFKTDVNVDELVAGVRNDIDAINMAIEAEKDSILFYYELQAQAFDEDKEAIDRVIQEEKSHYAKLINLRGQLTD